MPYLEIKVSVSLQAIFFNKPFSVQQKAWLTLMAGLAVTALAMIYFTYTAYQSYTDTAVKQSTQLEKVSDVLTDQTDQIFFSVNTSLDRLVGGVELRAPENTVQFKKLAGQEKLLQLLVKQAQLNNAIDVIAFVDLDGVIVGSSRVLPNAYLTASDRDYFQYLKNNNSPATFYSKPERNKTDSKWNIFVARRINNTKNQFLGVIVFLISVDELAKKFSSISANLINNAAISLYRDDLTLLVEAPKKDGLLGQKNTTGVIPEALEYVKKNKQAYFSNVADFIENNKPIERLIWANAILNYPLILVAEVIKIDYLTGWINKVLHLFIGTCLGLIILYALLTLLLKSFKRTMLNEYAATHDFLTKLPNRSLFKDRLANALHLAKRSQRKLAVLFIDLDKLKKINDENGHAIGDLAIKGLTQRVLSCIRSSDTLARIGGDEFILLLPNINNTQDALELGQKILQVIKDDIKTGNTVITLSASIGIAVYPDHGETPSQLIEHSDAAMYFAKTHGRNRVHLFNPAGQSPSS